MIIHQWQTWQTDRLRDRETDRQVHTHRACTWNSPLLIRQLCDDHQCKGLIILVYFACRSRCITAVDPSALWWSISDRRDRQTKRQRDWQTGTYSQGVHVELSVVDPSVLWWSISDRHDRQNKNDRQTDKQVHTHKACTWNSPLLIHQLCDDPSV